LAGKSLEQSLGEETYLSTRAVDMQEVLQAYMQGRKDDRKRHASSAGGLTWSVIIQAHQDYAFRIKTLCTYTNEGKPKCADFLLHSSEAVYPRTPRWNGTGKETSKVNDAVFEMV
jgi:hypothetical protein